MIIKLFENSSFWIGVCVANFMWLISDFIKDRNHPVITAALGVMWILLTAIHIMRFKESEES